MKLPGFTAETKLERTNEHYQSQHIYQDLTGDSNRNVHPSAGYCSGWCEGQYYQTYCPPGHDCYLSCVGTFRGMFCYKL